MSLLSVDLNDTSYTRVRPELFFNIDAMSVIKVGPPSAKSQTAYLTEGVQKEMREKHARNVGITGDQSTKYRCVKHHFITSADGQLHDICVLINDNNVKVLDVHRCIDKINGADVHLILYPANKAYKKRILDEINSSSAQFPATKEHDNNNEDDDNNSRRMDVDEEEEGADDNDENNNDLEADNNGDENEGLKNFDVLIMKAFVCDIMNLKVLAVLRDSIAERLKAISKHTVSSSSSSKGSDGLQITNQLAEEEDPNKLEVVEVVDGDFSQIENIMRSVVNKPTFKDEHLNIVKLSAGCSMALQPNDLMPGHRDLRSMVSVTDYTTKITKERLAMLPIFARQVEDILRGHGIEKASRDIFVNYCEDLGRLVSASMTVSKIKSGWEISGLWPFNPEQILRQCAAFDSLTDEEGELIRAKLPLLRERAYYSGHLTDKDMLEILGEQLFSSEIKNMSLRPLIQQRTVLLNSSAAIAIRRNKLEEKRVKDQEASQKKLSADGQKKLESAVKSAVQENRLELYAGPPFDDLPAFCCGNCKAVRDDNGAAIGDDGWRACPCCQKIWCCMKRKKCRNNMESHVSMCMATCYIMLGKVQLPPDIVNAAA